MPPKGVEPATACGEGFGGESIDDLVGRDVELVTIAAVGDGSSTGAALLLVGEPGIGKSTLLRVAAQRARDQGDVYSALQVRDRRRRCLSLRCTR